MKSYKYIVMRASLAALVCALPACSPACFLKPDAAYDSSKLVAQPDYSEPSSWVALPTTQDHADFIPQGTPAPPAQGKLPADVFYVHPTTWMDKKIWNDTLDSPKSDEIKDQVTMANQASAFNGCCNVYAPRYRQASIAAFFGEMGDAEQSLEVAYQDVERAFKYFIEHHADARPFIVASHSQGSLHAMRLLGMIDADPALRSRLVAAYVPGFKLPMSYYERVYTHLVPCREPEQIGCVLSWDTYTIDATVDPEEPLVHWFESKIERVPFSEPRQCVNPITWRMDGEMSLPGAHLGAVEMVNEGESLAFGKMLLSKDPLGIEITGLEPPRSDLLRAQCVEGILRVPDLDDLDYPEHETGRGNYHLLDYELFYMDVRANAITRTNAWLKAQKPKAERPEPALEPVDTPEDMPN